MGWELRCKVNSERACCFLFFAYLGMLKYIACHNEWFQFVHAFVYYIILSASTFKSSAVKRAFSIIYKRGDWMRQSWNANKKMCEGVWAINDKINAQSWCAVSHICVHRSPVTAKVRWRSTKEEFIVWNLMWVFTEVYYNQKLNHRY